MNRIAMAVLAALMFIPAAFADSSQTITINIGVTPPGEDANIIIPFSNLSGTPLNGQSETINFVFTSPEYIPTLGTLGAGMYLQTNEAYPGFITGVGYLIGANGEPMGAPIVLGSSDCSCGVTGTGIYPPPISTLTAVYGFQFDVTYPDSLGVIVGDGQLDINYTAVPEPSMWPMLLFGIALVVIFRFRKLAFICVVLLLSGAAVYSQVVAAPDSSI
jgi:hypothetical protein